MKRKKNRTSNQLRAQTKSVGNKEKPGAETLRDTEAVASLLCRVGLRSSIASQVLSDRCLVEDVYDELTDGGDLPGQSRTGVCDRVGATID